MGYLGGGDKVDLNNANVRAYVKYPGLYPTIAGKIVSHGPYKNVGDVFSASGLTGASHPPPFPPSSLPSPSLHQASTPTRYSGSLTDALRCLLTSNRGGEEHPQEVRVQARDP